MRQFFAAVAVLGLMTLAGCGDSIHWFPDGGGGGGGTAPVPPPSSATAIPTVQQDTVIFFLSPSSSPASSPYQVKFNNSTTSTMTTSISISDTSGGSSKYSVNGGTYTSASGTVKGGDLITVQHTSSNQGANQTVQSVLYVGSATATYTSTTSYLSIQTINGVARGVTDYKSPELVITSAMQLPNGFSFPANIKIDPSNTEGVNQKIWVNGTQRDNNYLIDPLTQGTVKLQLSHNTPTGSGARSKTVVILTPTSATGTPYKISFQSVTQ